MKPALLILDAWIEMIDLSLGGSIDFNQFTGYLKLSQEQSLNPGFLIGVAQVAADRAEQTSVGEHIYPLDASIHNIFHEHGSIWAPKYVGAAWFEQGVVTIRATMHLKYEMVEIPWVEWFVKWDFLDGITDNAEEH